MAGKRKANDENSGQFINTSGPPQKRPRRVAQTVTEASRMEARRQWEEKQRKEAVVKADFLVQREREEEAERRVASVLRIGQVLDAVKATGYKTLHEFLADLLATKDQHQSSQVSQTLINHGHELLELIRARHGSARPAEVDNDKFADPDNYGQDLDLNLGDLALDEEEFPAGIDPSDFVAMATEAILAMEETKL